MSVKKIGENDHASYQKQVVTVVLEHLQPYRCYQCIVGRLNRNSISDERESRLTELGMSREKEVESGIKLGKSSGVPRPPHVPAVRYAAAGNRPLIITA
ncbi:hypothetical protein EVAR_34039_1 [Eumeta japonica]|uniref:Uncharacterized protein n=1 Tax=Eumeta variegata TaxID=151549 RepID=A0A4C1VR50_EUMVA|nr:hypothetical protein EVAR_34039_1 [Eumeta japonica]